ncbi:MAG: hypothetical protein FJX66_02150 [Alphaproteobacteria bacterium]|nr:hypothetical protein [Alphaproteobacteria bacterium]
MFAVAAVVLVGCVSPEEYEARDRALCEEKTGVKQSEGADSTVATAYDRCRQDLAAKREAARRAQTEWNITNYRQNVGR